MIRITLAGESWPFFFGERSSVRRGVAACNAPPPAARLYPGGPDAELSIGIGGLSIGISVRNLVYIAYAENTPLERKLEIVAQQLAKGATAAEASIAARLSNQGCCVCGKLSAAGELS